LNLFPLLHPHINIQAWGIEIHSCSCYVEMTAFPRPHLVQSAAVNHWLAYRTSSLTTTAQPEGNVLPGAGNGQGINQKGQRAGQAIVIKIDLQAMDKPAKSEGAAQGAQGGTSKSGKK
jgi:hypothetical protein